MTDYPMTKAEWIRREIAAIKDFIAKEESLFAEKPDKRLYLNLDHSRRYLDWYSKQNAHLITG